MHGRDSFMRHLRIAATVLLAILFLISFASAQDFSKAEVFGGYSYLHTDTQGLSSSTLNNQCNIIFGGTCPVTFGIHPGFQGWNVAVQGNVNRWFGIKAQVTGQYGNAISIKFNPPLSIPFGVPGQNIYDLLFGPVISHREEKVTFFGHGLLGAQRVGLSGNIPVTVFPISTSETDFAFALGGGVDVKASKHFLIRIGQLEYEFVNAKGPRHENDFRFSAGVVFAFGGK